MSLLIDQAMCVHAQLRRWGCFFYTWHHEDSKKKILKSEQMSISADPWTSPQTDQTEKKKKTPHGSLHKLQKQNGAKP